MHRSSPLALTMIAALGLSACTNEAGSFYREAGSDLSDGQFGESTQTNHLINTGQISVAQALGRRFGAEVPPIVTFPFNSAALDSRARAILNKQANWIRQFPEVRFRVYGHTDLVGSSGYNKSLGLRRARAVVAYLATQGVSRSRLEALASFGETRPLVVTQGRERRNRRTVTEVSGFVQSHPLILNGKYAVLSHREYINTAIRGDTNKQSSTTAASSE